MRTANRDEVQALDTLAREIRQRTAVDDQQVLTCIGKATIQRWEHWACAPSEVAGWLERHGWRHEAVPGKVWRSGNPAHRWVRD